MDLGSYLAFVAVAMLLVLVPGADFAVVTRNTLAGGRSQGWATAFGIAASCAIQGIAAVVGLGALIVASQPLFRAVSLAGVAYLAYLAAQAARSAWRGDYPPPGTVTASPTTGFRQGFLSNFTNPKVLVFYLAVLPQFMASDAGGWTVAPLALTHAVLALLYLMALAALLSRIAAVLQRRRVRRTLDCATALALGGFSASVARSQI
jgi:threonine/homoserine/homoserine lactone efflux protein